MSTLNRALLSLLAGLIGLVISGCSESVGEDALQNYQSRLLTVFENVPGVGDLEVQIKSRSTDPTIVASPLPKISVVPAASRDGSSSIDLLDFLGLYGCRLQEVVAQANSSLGKFAANSQRLLSALKFIELAPECIESLIKDDKASLASLLAAELSYKQAQVNWLVAKAVFEGDEYRSFWGKPITLGEYPAGLSGEPIMALSRLNALLVTWSTGGVSDGVADLESQLFLVAQGDGGALIKAYELLNHALEVSDQVLDRALSSAALCQRSDVYSRDILSNVVQKFFVGEVQAWASALNRRQYEIMAAIEPLEKAMHQNLTQDYLRWRAQRDALFQKTTEQVRGHVQRLKVFLEPELLSETLAEICV